MVGHLFCWVSADVVPQCSDTRSSHLPQKDGTLLLSVYDAQWAICIFLYVTSGVLDR